MESNGHERYEHYYSPPFKAWRWQYTFRTLDGEFFTVLAATLGDARLKRDEWLAALRDGRRTA